MRFTILLLVFSASWSSLSGQTSGPATAKGPCSPAVTGNHNVFKIECSGISKEQGDQFLKILNKIASNQLDPNKVMEKLDDIQRGVDDIKKSTQPRHLTKDQADKLVGELSQFKNQTFTVRWNPGDPEAAAYAEDFENAFSRAGVPCGWDNMISGGDPSPPGLWVMVNLSDITKGTVPSAAGPFLEALRRAGIEVKGGAGMVDVGTFILSVNSKPQ
jgi:hypothetical protein